MNNFITKIIKNDIKNGLNPKNLKFRFSPEPNGFLHIGHIKAIYINFEIAKYFNSKINLRFDDTNPIKENFFFVKNIINNIKWLGYKWDKLCFTSDYFFILYKWAKKMIYKKKAYIEYKKDNKNKKIKNIDENIYYFKNMKNGKYEENSYVLRAKIKNIKQKNNFYLKDPIMYRIIKKNHYRTLNKWCIYPTYDWAHGQSDYIENISHSLCSNEFFHHKPLYNWFLKNIYNKKINKFKPKQIEFSRLKFLDTITSKREINLLKKKKIIKDYSDLRLSTINSLIKKGYKPEHLKLFFNNIGITNKNYTLSINKLNLIIKKKIIKKSKIIMVVINPIKIIIKNFKKNYIKWIKINKNYKIPFTREIYIEKEDFKINHNKNFYRLSFKNYIRLKYSYIIKAYKIKLHKNKIIKIYCKLYKNIKKEKIKSTLNWISKKNKKKINILDYKYIYFKKNKIYNINSLKNIKSYTNINIKILKKKQIYQFLRIGFFYLDKNRKFIKLFFMNKKY